MVKVLTSLLSPIFTPMGVSAADLSSYIEMVKGYAWAIVIALILLVVVLVLARHVKKGKKHLVRWTAVLSWVGIVTLLVNMMCYGPLYANVSGFLNASKAELTEETVKASKDVIQKVSFF